MGKIDTEQVSKTTAILLDKLAERDAAGLAKYGTTLDRRDLTSAQWLDHMTEEMLDAAGYAQALKRTLEEDPMDKLDRVVQMLEQLKSESQKGPGGIGYATESLQAAVQSLSAELGVPEEQVAEPLKRALNQLQFVKTG